MDSVGILCFPLLNGPEWRFSVKPYTLDLYSVTYNKLAGGHNKLLSE